MAESKRTNPGWRLDRETLDIVAEARSVMSLSNHEVIALWAKQWKEGKAGVLLGPIAKGGSSVRLIEQGSGVHLAAVGIPGQQDKPMAQRVETPYQLERRMKLEALRAGMESGNGVDAGEEVVAELKGPDAPVLPFDVVVNGEKHRVREFHGRRVLEWIGPKVNVMKKNLTPQETVIYWRQRVK